ncbi:MAG: hypothetical protein GX129_03945 [Clostridiales bacterium]|nr:hypothetical protein [Clostridiales bacterium]
MKKLLILSFSCILIFSLYGCSKAALEKEPVVIEDSLEDNIPLSEPEHEQDTQANDEEPGHKADAEVNPEDTSSDIPSNDRDQSDNESQETPEPFKGIVMLEGMEEEVNYLTYQSEYGYQMAYDIDRFTVTSENGIDTYMAENINPELYPYVFVNIYKSKFDDGNRDFSGDLKLFDKASNETVTFSSPMENVKLGNYDAIHYEYIHGNQWNSLVRHIYVISLENDYYVIHTNYFLEASEGYGVRIEAMLDTIVIEEN